MPDTTLQGVTLFSRSRRKDTETFQLNVSPAGIEIRRSGQDPRLLAWDRVTTWEIEQRKRDVLLVLRGGGSVTPLLIPGWTVEGLDALLRGATAHLARTATVPEEATGLTLPEVADEPELAPQVGLDLPPPVPAEEPDDASSLELPRDVPELGSDPASPVALDPDMESPDPVPVEAAPDMDLALPSHPPAGPAGALEEMDLTLPPLPPHAELGTLVIDDADGS